MSGTGNTAGGKRKRRTFWEPESERLIAWLDAQADLGTSLQLIIVDAIKKYGEGDVIKAHLKQRENFFYEEAPHQQSSVRTELSVQDEAGDKDRGNEDLTLSFDSEPKVDQSPIRDLGHEPEAENEAEPELESDVQIDTDSDKPVFNNANSIAESSDKEQKEEEVKYDPIAILMRDSGSTLND